MLINKDKAPVARYIMLNQRHKYIHVIGSRKDFKKELLTQKKIEGQIRLWKEWITSFFWSPTWLWLFCGWDSTLVFLCLFLVLDSIPLFWLVALRLWFNSFLEALKMLTWCLHSKLDKMGALKRLETDNCCIRKDLAHCSKSALVWEFWEEFFSRTIQRQIEILRHSS